MFCIALATYNGERFLPELLTSIQEQTFRSWILLVRDDGSTDGTLSILKERAARDARIELLSSEEQLGPSLNFGRIMRVALNREASYLAFADQDDVWQPEKLATQLRAIEDAETQHGVETPMLVHSDVSVVNETLQTIDPSFRKFSRRHLNTTDPLSTLLAHNFVIGCSTVVNKALLKVAVPVPESAFMHDWWVALLAASAGKLIDIDKPLVQYRQHNSNSIGAGRSSYFRALVELVKGEGRWAQDIETHRRTIEQAHALQQRLQTLSHAVPDRLTKFCNVTGAASSRLSQAMRLATTDTLELPLARKAVFLMRTLATRQARRAA